MTLRKGEFSLVPLISWALPIRSSRKTPPPPVPPLGLGASASLSPLSGGACGAASMGSAGLPLMLLLAGVLARIPGSEGGKETPAHFLYQTKHECSFLNGTRRVRFLQRYFYDRQEYLRFDSARGEFEAVTALGKGDARAWNRNQRLLLDAKASVDYFCRANCEALQGGAVIGRREPRSSNSAKSKLWTGIVAAVIGVIFFTMGLSLHLKSKKATPIQPPAALMN